jgi:hypothetical protein
MEKEEIIAFLKENLTLTVYKEYNCDNTCSVEIMLKLGDDILGEGLITIENQ